MIGPAIRRGFKLMVPSRFGYLRSTLPANASVQADVFAELLNNLGVHKVGLIAISAGAWSALQFARRYPALCCATALIVPARLCRPEPEISAG